MRVIDYKITQFIEPNWAPKGVTKSYNLKKENDQKVRTHVYKRCLHTSVQT